MSWGPKNRLLGERSAPDMRELVPATVLVHDQCRFQCADIYAPKLHVRKKTCSQKQSRSVCLID